MTKEIQIKFYKLYRKYKSENDFKSSLDTTSDTFKEIVAMGEPIIPLLVANLFNDWLPILVLPRITKAVLPFEEDDAGKFEVISSKWLDWAEAEWL